MNVIVTAGPTHEALDPVRYMGNRSSGMQGVAIANAFKDVGASVTLIMGPVDEKIRYESVSSGVKVIDVVSAADMEKALFGEAKADVVAMAAAVADWRPAHYQEKKRKKQPGEDVLYLEFLRNNDILKTIGESALRPRLLIGFAAETAKNDDELLELAHKKRMDKGCDWIVANDVSRGKAFGQKKNSVLIVEENERVNTLNDINKEEIARCLALMATKYINGLNNE